MGYEYLWRVWKIDPKHLPTLLIRYKRLGNIPILSFYFSNMTECGKFLIDLCGFMFAIERKIEILPAKISPIFYLCRPAESVRNVDSGGLFPGMLLCRLWGSLQLESDRQDKFVGDIISRCVDGRRPPRHLFYDADCLFREERMRRFHDLDTVYAAVRHDTE